jgi:hypothetical protein
MKALTRILAPLILGFGMVVMAAGPASAHTVSGVGATNWSTQLTSVQPAAPGLHVRVVELGNRLELSNTGPDVIVMGYNSEPYLQVGAGGVFENLNSQATYLNQNRLGNAPIPPGLPDDPNAPPRWQRASAGHVVRWHDHRIHWMGGAPPPAVQRAPNQRHLQSTWQVNLRQGATPIAVTGTLTWVPGPSPWPWLGGALVLAVGCAVLGRLRHWGVLLAIAVGVLMVFDITHSLGIAGVAAGGLSTKLARFVAGSYYSFVGWILGVVAIWLLLRRSIDGLYAAVFTAASALLFSGLLDFSTLHRSQAPFLWGVVWDRLSVTVALGGGLGVALGALWALRRAPTPTPTPSVDDEDPSEAPSPISLFRPGEP